MAEEVNWKFIFIDKTFKNYLSFSDFCELSLVSKYLRNKLCKNIFDNFSFTLFSNKKSIISWITNETVDIRRLKVAAYKNNYIELVRNYRALLTIGNKPNFIKFFINPFSELDLEHKEEQEKFKNKLKAFKGQVTSLDLSDMGDFYHIFYTIPDLFSNLQSLNLTRSTLPINLCQYLFDNLKSLTSINLSNLIMLQSRKSPINLKYPNSTQQLILEKCLLLYIENNLDPIPFDTKEGFVLVEHVYPLFPKNLPKMLSLAIYGFDQYDSNLVDFLDLNPQIKHLYLDAESFDFTAREKFILQNSLTHLHIMYGLNQFINIDPKALSNVKKLDNLEIYVQSTGIQFKEIKQPFSNISNLTIHYDFYENFTEFEDQNLLSNQFKNFLSLFPNIKTLKVIFTCNSYNFRRYLSFKYSDFKEFEEFSKIFNNITYNQNQFNQLKHIRFYSSNSDKKLNGEFKLSIDNNNWNIIKFCSKIIIYSKDYDINNH